ncbi:MAG: hypothetical protein M1169_00535 [Firmicutes bacterium]|nr:hypothetical protein [Bacillota bacterium]
MLANSIRNAAHKFHQVGAASPSHYNALEEALKNDPNYQNISSEDVSRYLNYLFVAETKKGFPWYAYRPAEKGSKRAPISPLEVYTRMESGKPIAFSRKQKVAFAMGDLALSAVALGPQSAMANLAQQSISGGWQPKMMDREQSTAPEIYIPNKAYLKLLYQIHSGDIPKDASSEVVKTAKDLSVFIKKGKSSSYFFEFHVPERKWKDKLGSAFKAFDHDAVHSAMLGVGLGAVGSLFGGFLGHTLVAMMGGYLITMVGGAALGALIGGLRSAMKSWDRSNGKKIHELDAMDRLLKEQPVNFQEDEFKSYNIPLVGTYASTKLHSQPSKVSNTKELSILASTMSDLEHSNPSKGGGGSEAPADDGNGDADPQLTPNQPVQSANPWMN